MEPTVCGYEKIIPKTFSEYAFSFASKKIKCFSIMKLLTYIFLKKERKTLITKKRD
jgi:hypothetical protein